MRIAYVAAGAGGMYCGSCMHDNTLAAALLKLGHEVALLPTYTPLRTDEQGVALPRVFYGALNVYLQQKLRLFRRTPWLLDRLLDRPRLLSWVSRFAGSTDARELGELTLSMLLGEEGHQAKELEKLAAWLADEYRPEVIHLTNSLFLGMAKRLRERVGVPVVVSVQGEDLFVGELPEPYKKRVTGALKRKAGDADAIVATSRYYAEAMGELLGVPPERLHVVPLGIRLDGHAEGDPLAGGRDGATIGYLARVCPEKGLHLLVEAFRQLAGEPGRERLKLRVAGYLGAKDRAYFDDLARQLAGWGLAGRFEYVGEVDLAGKIRFLRSLDALAVPTVYRESKGLFALEAMANAVPVVLPRHGSLPEMIEATGGGVLVEPGSPEAVAAGLRELLDDPERRRELGERGRRAVHEQRSDRTMAERTEAVYRAVVPRPAAVAAAGAGAVHA